MTTPDQWNLFLAVPLAVLEEYGLSNRTILILEREYHAIYVRDIQMMTIEQCLSTKQLSKNSVSALQRILRIVLQAVERGELEWILDDSKVSKSG